MVAENFSVSSPFPWCFAAGETNGINYVDGEFVELVPRMRDREVRVTIAHLPRHRDTLSLEEVAQPTRCKFR